MTITVYRSTDVGAPTFAPNVQGSLISVLDACLVNGYGSKPSAGWTKAFSGTRPGSVDPWEGGEFAAAVYKMPAGTSEMYMYISEARHSWYICGYENISSLDHTTATGQFPRYSMLWDTTGGHYGWYGYKTEQPWQSAPLVWELVTNGKFFFFFYRPRSPNYWDNAHGGRQRAQMWFGDYLSYKPGDAYNCLCAGMGRSYPTGQHCLVEYWLNDASYGGINQPIYPSAGLGLYGGNGIYPLSAARGADMAINGVRMYPMYNYHMLSGEAQSYGVGWSGSLSLPNPVDGGVFMEPIQLREYISSTGQHGVRGKIPGIYMLQHGHSLFEPGVPFQGTGSYAGKQFEVFGSSGYYSMGVPTSRGGMFPGFVIETTPTGDWT